MGSKYVLEVIMPGCECGKAKGDDRGPWLAKLCAYHWYEVIYILISGG